MHERLQAIKAQRAQERSTTNIGEAADTVARASELLARGPSAHPTLGHGIARSPGASGNARLLRPYSVYERAVDEQLLQAVQSLSTHVGRIRQQLRAAETRDAELRSAMLAAERSSQRAPSEMVPLHDDIADAA